MPARTDTTVKYIRPDIRESRQSEGGATALPLLHGVVIRSIRLLRGVGARKLSEGGAEPGAVRRRDEARYEEVGPACRIKLVQPAA